MGDEDETYLSVHLSPSSINLNATVKADGTVSYKMQKVSDLGITKIARDIEKVFS